jgi:hypothetical protein
MLHDMFPDQTLIYKKLADFMVSEQGMRKEA